METESNSTVMLVGGLEVWLIAEKEFYWDLRQHDW